MENAIDFWDDAFVSIYFGIAASPNPPDYSVIPESIKEIEITGNLETLHSCAFAGLLDVEKITIPSSVTTIEESAFAYCRSLETFEIPKNVKELGYSAFNAAHLKELTLEEGSQLETIKDGAFAGNDMTSFVFPKGSIKIGNYTFAYCRNLQTLYFPGKISSWVYSTDIFEYCDSLTDIYTSSSEDEFGKTQILQDCYKNPTDTSHTIYDIIPENVTIHYNYNC